MTEPLGMVGTSCYQLNMDMLAASDENRKKTRGREWLFACMGVTVAIMAGCGTTATITRRSAPPVEAEIVAVDSRNVYVGGASKQHAVSKDDIVDIDHPGDGAIVAGLLVGTYGIINISVGAKDCERQEGGAAYCVGVFSPAALGLGLLGYGLIVHSDSQSALERRLRRHPRGRDPSAAVSVVPSVSIGPDGAGQGTATLRGRF